MKGSLLNLAIKDSKRYITKGGFESEISLETPDSNTTVDVTGYATKHWLRFQDEISVVNTKSAHICISEEELREKLYPVRNSGNEVDLYQHRVKVIDSSNLIRSYVITETYPNETLGLIVCILSDIE